MINNWISVADELPEISLAVLVWVGKRDSDHYGCTIGYFEQKNVGQDPRRVEVVRRWYDVFNNSLSDVVAWQPLPFGPNGEAVISRNLSANMEDWVSVD